MKTKLTRAQAIKSAIKGVDSKLVVWNSVHDTIEFLEANGVHAHPITGVINEGLPFFKEFKADLIAAFHADSPGLTLKTAENRVVEFLGGGGSEVKNGMACGYREKKAKTPTRKPGKGDKRGTRKPIPKDATHWQRTRSGVDFYIGSKLIK